MREAPAQAANERGKIPAAALAAASPALTWLRRSGRALLWLAVMVYFAFALILIGVRHFVLPNIDAYRGNIEALLSSSLNLPVTIGGIEASWRGWNPHLALSGFAVHDREGRPALGFDTVTADVSWTSLLHLKPRLKRLEVLAPSLAIRRDQAGKIFVAGLPVSSASDDHGFSDWLIEQRHIVIRDASITWQDDLRGAPPLKLEHLNFHLQNQGRWHRFGLTADPPAELAARLELRGEFRGDDLDLLAAAKGKVYAELAYADLAVWRTWIDYPLELPRGSGGMRLWLDFQERELRAFTSDINLAQVEIRLAPELPLLELQSLSGRLSATRLAQGFEASARDLALTTKQGAALSPSDFQLQWTEPRGAAAAHGSLAAESLDLDALSSLAAYLPFTVGTRQRLAEAAPQGRVSQLRLSWRGALDAPEGYRLRARFDGLGMRAMGQLPGFKGLSGSIDGSDKSGSVTLASKDAVLELARVFARPTLELASLNARVNWKRHKNGYELRLASAAFENRDAAGTASGSYRATQDEAGQIDLNARLTRADASAIWRYIPLAVSAEVRDWLRAALQRGSSDEATLRLKGDLKRFPYADGSGVFEVKGRFQGVSLRYAPDWPAIDNIAGELHFVGRKMTVKASRGSTYGMNLAEVSARIEDMEAANSPLIINGRASGPSADFLRFIDESPVAEWIDHYTDDMAASGNGQLMLRLALPLADLAGARVDGSYQFANNRLVVGPDLPPLTELGGRLQFSGDSLKAERVRATVLDMPIAFDLKSTGDGAVALSADGSFNIVALRRRYAHPLLDHLSGSASWRGTALLRKKNVALMVESKLEGISSSLPEPFNKSAAEPLSLRLQRKLLPAAPQASGVAPLRDQIDLSLGNGATARLQRRLGGGGEQTVIERGSIAIGPPAPLPSQGLALGVRQERVDIDLWRALLGKMEGESAALPALRAVTLDARELVLFGHSVNDLSLKASAIAGGWQGTVRSREATGELEWRGGGDGAEGGRLSARMKRLELGDTLVSGATSADDVFEKLPGLDVTVDMFILRGKPFGKLKLSADNRKGIWEAKLSIDNSDGKLTGAGKWQPSNTQADTQLRFTLDVQSIERLLARFGYPDAVRRGQATLSGAVSWNGTPFAIDYPSLSGELEVQAARGQFNKLEPGAGRLLGILSLQSLPRRITLDFRDVFSEGFAFDGIAGKLNIDRGIMESQDLRILGPGAKVMMRGSVNLPQETQNLTVRVQPSLGDSLSVGALLLASPAAGAIAYLAQKLLRDPIDQMFSYEYAVTGTWADPKVEKLSAPRARREAQKNAGGKAGAQDDKREAGK